MSWEKSEISEKFPKETFKGITGKKILNGSLEDLLTDTLEIFSK